MTSIRRGQLITTQGIGSIITDKENESFLILSTDSWVYLNKGRHVVYEPRLQRYLGVKRLIEPPPSDKKSNLFGAEREREFIKTIRFPSWHFCSHYQCRTLQTVDYDQKIGPCCNHELDHRGQLTPVRFLSVCENGHIDDFPFQEWVHGTQAHKDHVLHYEERADRTGLAGIIIKCKTCGKQRSMQGALSPDSLRNIQPCKGHRPWLYNGKNRRGIDESCKQPLQGVQKAASNVYLPVVRNSIFIPKQDSLPNNLSSFLGNPVYISTVKSISDKPTAITIIKSLGLVEDGDAEIIYKAIYDSNDEKDLKYTDIKETEYSAFKRGSLKKSKDFECIVQGLGTYQSWFQKYFSAVSLVDKLRDTRAYVGFTRIKPFDEFDKSVRSLIKQISPDNELPVDVVRGEGIFIEFNPTLLDKWKSLPNVNNRLKLLHRDKIEALEKSYQDPAIFVLLHTFAHILINELCLVAGYNNSSLRERIYSTSKAGPAMTGVLIYTNSGDSEGSLGGLVRNGKPGILEPLVLSALQKADWCSSDPVCSEVIPQGQDASNLAACHNCCLLPETACENINSFLDRGLLCGSLSDSSFGYFTDIKVLNDAVSI